MSKKIDNTEIAFNIELNKYLDIDIEKGIPLDNLVKKITNKKNGKDTSSLEKILLELIEKVNPSTKSFISKLNQLLSLNILTYLRETKEKKGQVNSKEVLGIISQILINKNETSINKIIKDIELISDKELYIKLLISFITSNQIDSIVNLINKKFQKNVVDYIKNILDGLNLKNDKSFEFLGDILFKIVNNNNEINLINEIEQVKAHYISEEKNDYLHCNKCYSLPILEINEDKKINIKYSCSHVEEKDLINPENIFNFKIKCFCCEDILLNTYKNWLCSNCKNIVCNKCKQKHFNECLSLFFINLTDVGTICTDHNKKYELFCYICKCNLCPICKDEHQHFSEYGFKDFSNEDNDKIMNFIKKDKNNNKIIMKLIESIILNKQKYLQYQYFFEKLLNKKIVEKCGFFDVFGGSEFNKYYSNLIEEVSKGTTFYINSYDEIKNIYINAKREVINTEPTLNYIHLLYKKSLNFSKVYAKNSSKYSLLNNYYFQRKALLDEIDWQKIKIGQDNMKIKL